MPELGCQRAAIRASAVVLWLLFVLLRTILRRIQSGIFESSVKRRQNCIDNEFICVNFEKKKTLMASFRQRRSTTTSFMHKSVPFPVKAQRINRIAQF